MTDDILVFNINISEKFFAGYILGNDMDTVRIVTKFRKTSSSFFYVSAEKYHNVSIFLNVMIHLKCLVNQPAIIVLTVRLRYLYQ